MKLKSRRERILLGLTVLVLLGLGGWYGFLNIKVALDDMDTRISDLETDLRSKQRLEREDRAVADRYERVKKELTIPGSESEVTSAIREELTRLLSGEDGLGYTSIQAKPPTSDSEGFLTTHQFSIDQTKASTISNLARFLNRMETESEVLEIETIQVSNPRRPRDDQSGSQYEFTIPQIVISRLVYTQSDENASSRKRARPRPAVEEEF